MKKLLLLLPQYWRTELLLPIWVCLSFSAAGQNRPDNSTGSPDKEQRAAIANRAVQLGVAQTRKRSLTPTTNTSTTSLVSPFTQIALTAKSGDQEASAALGATLRDTWLLSATLKQPFKEKPSRVTPLTLDGLNQGSSAIFAIQYTPRPDLAPDLEQRIRSGDMAPFRAFEKVRLAYAIRKKLIVAPTRSCDSVVTNSLCPADQKTLDEITYRVMAKDLSKEEIEQLIGAQLTYVSPWLFGASVAFGKVQYDYITNATATSPSNMTGVNRNVRGYFGKALTRNSVLAASYTFQRKYQTATDTPISFSYPLSTTGGTSTTQDVYVGTPTLATTSRITLEYRQLFIGNTDNTPFLALNPSIHVLTNTQKLAVNAAIYLLRTDDEGKPQGLQGGVAFGYLTASKFNFQSFDEGVSAEVFISAPFNLFDFSK